MPDQPTTATKPTVDAEERDSTRADRGAVAAVPTPARPTVDATAVSSPASGEGRASASTSDDSEDLAPGARIGDYRIDSELGAGSFGAVYAATHAVIGKRAAIKVLKREHASDETTFNRFVGEARAVNAIAHPNIVDIFGFGKTDDGRHFIVMELLRGESLATVVANRGRLPLTESLEILRPLADAIAAAHTAGITHRDLKPDNVFLHRAAGTALVPKLLDFGIAKLPAGSLDSGTPLTRAGWVVGTPGYMAPEQTVGETVDGRADVYAFGVLAFRMIAGRLPFDARSLKDILAAQLQEPPPSLSVLAPELPRHLDPAFRWLLHKDVPLRCPDMNSAIAALEGSLAVPAEALTDPSLNARTVNARSPGSSGDARSGGNEAALDPTVVAMPALMREADAARRRTNPFLKVALVFAIAIGATFAWVKISELTGAADDPNAPSGASGSSGSGIGSSAATGATAASGLSGASGPMGATGATGPTAAPRLIAIDGDPAGAEIFGANGTKFGKVPAVLELSPAQLPLEIELRKDGFVPQTFRIGADSPERVRVSLTPRRAKPLTATQPAP